MIPNAHSLSIINNPSRPKNKQAAHAERLGYYAQAKRLWGQVIVESKKDSLLRHYASIRRAFCESAIKNGYKRPELRP